MNIFRHEVKGGEQPTEDRETGAQVRRRLVAVARALVALALALAGAVKVADPAVFAADIGHYRLVPPLLAGVLALYLPYLELLIAAGLWVPAWRRGAQWAAAGLLLGFSAALVSVLARDIDLACGCYGASFESSAGWALARNVALLCLLAAGWRRRA